MPVFTFSGKNSAGEKVTGERVAANKQVLALQLRREQIAGPTIREKGKENLLLRIGCAAYGALHLRNRCVNFRSRRCARVRFELPCRLRVRR